MNVEANATFEAVTDFFGITGLVGTLTVRVDDNTGATAFGPTTAGVAEIAAGIYSKPDMTAPGALGQFTIIWDDTGGNLAIEDLLVVAAGSEVGPFPPVPAEGPDEPVMGPCTAWTTGDEVAACAGVEVSSMNEELLTQVAVEASMVLYPLTAYKYSGQCSHEARPCRRRRTCLHDWGMWDDEAGYACGCGLLSQITLPGYPVTSVTEVLIDGVVVDADTYRLERDWTTLTRVRDPADPDTRLYWPACQDLTINDLTAEGTWVVRYLGGINPPPLGMRAAAELAAELLRACPGSGTTGECKLPAGITSLTRQGVSMDFSGFRSFAFDRSLGAWNTGLKLVDAFLNTDNPTGRKLPSAFFSPDAPYYAEQTVS